MPRGGIYGGLDPGGVIPGVDCPLNGGLLVVVPQNSLLNSPTDIFQSVDLPFFKYVYPGHNYFFEERCVTNTPNIRKLVFHHKYLYEYLRCALYSYLLQY